MNWHGTEADAVLQELQSDRQRGLSAAEAQARLDRYGRNELLEKGGRTPSQILWEQLTATMVLILLVGAALAGALGDSKNSLAILAIVALYALLGFVQEYRAERAVAALKRLSVPNVRVTRNGALAEISARDLVPGDILHLQAGNVVPADARLLEAVNLRTQEAALTGESLPIDKLTSALTGDALPLGDRQNMAYLGTVVAQGRGVAVVVATGMQTEVGKIADLLQQTRSAPTPLQRRLDRLGKVLAVAGVAIATLILTLGLARGDELRLMLLTAVSVAVAIVPEGLPAVVTITLALGARSMLQRNALIRKLLAVETLGSVTVICSDKTGTLTENKMTVVAMEVADHMRQAAQPKAPSRELALIPGPGLSAQSSLSLLALGGALCNDATLVPESEGLFNTIGDPTEGALVSAAARMGYLKPTLEAALPRAAELPFDSGRKRMTTIHQNSNHGPANLAPAGAGDHPYIAFTKGSVDGLLGCSTQIAIDGQVEILDDRWRARIEATNERLAREGMRVLGVAYRLLDRLPATLDNGLESELTFVGLFGMLDPPRAGVKEAVALTRSAGVRTVMITGDHPVTATTIAQALGILENGRVVTGAQLDAMPLDELRALVGEVGVFARVSPEHKLTIVQALQENGHIVAMTGDGVNDAPALRRADIGLAMGITGTDVAREASEMVLLDDNYVTIVAAVQEGRRIYDNLRKFVHFAVGGNIGKVLVVLLGPFLGMPLPLLPLQLLWLNLLTDGLLGLAMGVEQGEVDAMRRRPYSPREGVFSRGAALRVVLIGLLIGGLGLGAGAWYYFGGHDSWQTMAFTSLAFAQIGQALAVRSSLAPLLATGWRSNPLLVWMIVAVFALQMVVVYFPPLQAVFTTQPLPLVELAVALGAGVIVFAAIEAAKTWTWRRSS